MPRRSSPPAGAAGSAYQRCTTLLSWWIGLFVVCCTNTALRKRGRSCSGEAWSGELWGKRCNLCRWQQSYVQHMPAKNALDTTTPAATTSRAKSSLQHTKSGDKEQGEGWRRGRGHVADAGRNRAQRPQPS